VATHAGVNVHTLPILRRETYAPAPVTRRSYNQYCSLAEALDVIGERWTLLVVRELSLGPRRFGQLLENLPGMGRNLLTARLRHLEDEGLARRRDGLYELTEEGRELGPALAELSRWGVRRRLGPPRPGQVFRAAWGMFPLAYMANAKAARGVHDVYEFRVGGETFHLRVDDGAIEPRAGAAERPDLVVTMAPATLQALFAQQLDPVEAIGAGRIAIEGGPDVLGRALAILAG
jgi:DNA-binding HxlR family transcriptional regulator